MNNLIEILHRISGQLSNVKEEKQIYQIMNDAVREILPNAYFVITKLQDDDLNFRIIHSFGFDKYLAAIKTLIGKDPFRMDFPFNKLSESKQKEFKSKQLVHFPEGIYGIVSGKINKTVCKTIENILGISDVYAISLCMEDKFFGGANIFIPKSTGIKKKLPQEIILALESIAFQASFAINKLQDYENLLRKDKELRIAHLRFNQIINQLDVMVWQAKGDGTELVDLNNSFEKISGYTSSAFFNNPNLWFDIVYQEDQSILEKANTYLTENGNADCEYRIKTSDGKIVWLHDRKSIVFDDSGTPVQMGGILSDITEKKLLEERLTLKNYALDNSPSAVGFADLTGNITYVNNKYVKLFGYKDKKEIIGKHISEFASTVEQPEKVFSTIRKGEVYIGQGIPKRKDGSTFYSIISASPVISNKKILCVMAVFEDITDLKEMELQLKKSESRLSKLNKEKDKFFTIIAHDLKSPFNGMLGLLEIIAKEYTVFNDEQRLKMIKASHDSAQKAFTLLLDLLEWARLQNNQVEIKKEEVNLSDIVNETIDINKDHILTKEISIKNNIKETVQVEVDINSIKTVVRNIFTNAIKFTQSGGEIEFSLKKFNDAVELIIKDSGVGMSEETISKLFKLDENVTMPGTDNEKGTGLGLIICNEIVSKNEWEMNVESQIGKGSTFKILIPTN